MKKYIIFLVLLINLVPYFEQGSLKIGCNNLFAQCNVTAPSPGYSVSEFVHDVGAVVSSVGTAVSNVVNAIVGSSSNESVGEENDYGGSSSSYEDEVVDVEEDVDIDVDTPTLPQDDPYSTVSVNWTISGDPTGTGLTNSSGSSSSGSSIYTSSCTPSTYTTSTQIVSVNSSCTTTKVCKCCLSASCTKTGYCTLVKKDDCDQQSINNASTTSWVRSQNWSNEIGQIKTSSKITGSEYAVTVSYSSQCSCYSPSNIFSGSANEVTFDYSLTQIYPTGSGMFDYRGSVAQAHTHPSSAYPAPSAKDLFTLANIGTGNMMFKNIFTLGADGSEYSMYVEDANKLQIIKLQYAESSSVDGSTYGFKPTSSMGMEFQNAYVYFRIQNLPVNDAYAYAFAYVLGAFDTGVKLLKKDGSSFKERHAIKQTDANGNITYRASDCK